MKTIVRCTIFLCSFFLISVVAAAQSAITQYTTNYVSSGATSSYSDFPANPGTFSPCSATSYAYSWRNGTSNHLKLTSFTANSKTFVVSPPPSAVVKLRRVNNANATGNRMILYSESTTSPASTCVTPAQLNFKAPYNDNMESLLNNNVLNHGTDNIFTNASNGDGNNNNIERVDVIFPFGVSSSLATDAGFGLFERGNNNAHDGFRIAAILSLDASGDPASFGAAKTCTAGNGSNNGSWGHPSLANGNVSLSAYVLRKDAAETYLRVSSNVNQEIGGVYFSFGDLGVAANQVIYGYSLIGPDGTANPTSAQLLTTSNAAIYPTATTEAQGGGLDLISVNSLFASGPVLASQGLNTFKGRTHYASNILTWNLTDLPAATTVSLERSDNAISFTSLYSYITPTSTSVKTYTDKALPQSWYYRLRLQFVTGKVEYSQTILLSIDKNNELKVYPNITTTGQPLNVKGIPDGAYSANFQNINGEGFHKINFIVRGGMGWVNLNNLMLSPGIYLLSVEKEGLPVGKMNKILINSN